MIIDASYTADAIAWLIVWSATGVVGRELLARHDASKRGERLVRPQWPRKAGRS